MTYVDDARTALERHLPRELPAGLVDLYALLVLRSGVRTSREDVHDAWAVWQSRENPAHPSILPLDQLGDNVQASDDPYVEAVQAAAHDLNV